MLSQNMDDQEALGALMHQLGNHKATYKRQFFAPSRLLAISCIVGIFLYSILMIILVSFIENVAILLVVPALVIAGLLLLECILIFYRNRKLCVFVYENGLIHRGRDSLLTIIYWKNVRYVSHTLEKTMWSDPVNQEPSYRSVYTVSCTNGTVLRLDETFAKLRQLGESLKRKTANDLFSAT